MLSDLARLVAQFPTFNDLPLNSSHPNIAADLRPIAEGRYEEDLLLIGANGSGKSTLATLLPHYYSASKGEKYSPYEIDAFDLDPIAMKRSCLFSNFVGDFDWIVIHELDKVGVEKMQHPLLNIIGVYTHKKFIITANNLSDIDRGIESRCNTIEIVAPSLQDYLPYALKLLQLAGKNVSQSKLGDELRPYEGDLRSMERRLQRLLRGATRLSA
jgi:energy-coupling factor transporter ATP-binding protein EcfA2